MGKVRIKNADGAGDGSTETPKRKYEKRELTRREQATKDLTHAITLREKLRPRAEALRAQLAAFDNAEATIAACNAILAEPLTEADRPAKRGRKPANAEAATEAVA